TSPASSRLELHEVVTGDGGTMTMRPKDGGFLVPANGSASLTPGGDHLMFMDLSAPLLPGAETDLTLIYDDGSSTTFTAQIRDFSGNQENYDPNHGG
ncbi:MAG: copper chaperone PCu(A)C, partial [Rhodococcus sp. (in: high G+C Gram-positive bacteria)]